MNFPPVVGALYLCTTLVCSAQEFTFPLELPKCPNGSVLVIYQMNWSEKQTNLRPHLESLGVRFPKDGYAILLPNTNFAIVATTPDEQKRICKFPEESILRIHSFDPSSTQGQPFGK